jgi:AraC family transcriptional regulator, transcriptional activator of pobA
MHSSQSRPALQALLIKIEWGALLNHSPTSSGRSPQLCSEFFRLVDSHFRQRHKVGFYAQQLFISPDHLRQTCKTITGYPPSLFITSRLLAESVQLLSGGGAISQIALELGFESHPHFCHFFKRHVGCSPLEFRHSVGMVKNL